VFEQLGSLAYRHRRLFLLLSGVFLALSVTLLVRGGRLTSGRIHNLEASQARSIAAEVQKRDEETTVVVIFRAPELSPRTPAFRAAVERALDPLRQDPRVSEIITPETADLITGPHMFDDAHHQSLALVAVRGEYADALAAYPELRAKLHSDQLEITCTGQLAYMHDLDSTLAHDLMRAELISIPLALLVLLLVFRTVVAAVLPVGVGALAVVGGIAIVTALSRVVDVAQYTINVCSLIGLGVAIDYSLFVVSRYREELAAGYDYPEALSRTMATAGRVVTFSGVAVGTGLAGLLFFEGSYLAAMGGGGAIVVGLAIVFALTFLPALLAVLGPRIHALRLLRPSVASTSAGRWHAMVSAVMRRPLLFLLPTIAVLLVLGAPFAHIRLAAADVRVLSGASEARRGYDVLHSDFPAMAATRMTVAVKFPTGPALTRERIGALFDLSRRLAKLPGVKRVESIVDGDDPDTEKETYEDVLLDPPPMFADMVAMGKKAAVGDSAVLMWVVTDEAPDSDGARAVLRALRVDRRVGDGTLLVGGRTAMDTDSTDFIVSRTPRAVGLVVAGTLVVLFLLFGSVVLPIKAVVMNVFSIAGSFGALVWVFQDGHLFVKEGRPLEPSVPVLLFCVLFGLSMDYEVLMLSRIKESYDASGDNTQAVADGLEKTAGLITSAAAIMVSVFSAFAMASVVLLQAVGLGMALAVALDATLVRVLLVPSTMRLFGDANWWAPKWMLWLRARCGFGGDVTESRRLT
jgi:RND superfamily putative drug exporter